MMPKEIMRALQWENPKLKEALDKALKQKNEITPLLLECLKNALQKAIKNVDDLEHDDGSYIIAAYLLAKFREKSAFSIFIDLMKFDKDAIDIIWGDIMVDDMDTFLRDTFNAKQQLLKEVIENSSYFLWSRIIALKAYSCICYDGHIKREELIIYIRGLIDKICNDKRYSKNERVDIFTYGILEVVLEQKLIGLNADIKKLYDKELLEINYCGDYNDFLQEMINPANDIFYVRKSHIDDVAGMLAKWQVFEDESHKEKLPQTTAVLDVELKYAPYKITRQIQVPMDITLSQLHEILQIVFEWENCHLYDFNIDGQRYASINEDDADIDEEYAAENVRLRDALNEVNQFQYDYDFGDNWEHKITLKKIIQTSDKNSIPKCLKAKGEAPFEDVGGVGGFRNLLDVANKKFLTEEEQELIDWTGYSAEAIRDYPKYAVDIDGINESIKKDWQDIKDGKTLGWVDEF
ncbi:MAG: DUF1186 domain-containing protein [Elusimicrobiota bacterium]|jgi:hypothetical protein|nr:DUF1186 domain-containing protein [Elusimicrobiota bacterium]